MTTIAHLMPKRTELILKAITILLLLTYIVLCTITCISNQTEKEPQWMEWENK